MLFYFAMLMMQMCTCISTLVCPGCHTLGRVKASSFLPHALQVLCWSIPVNADI